MREINEQVKVLKSKKFDGKHKKRFLKVERKHLMKPLTFKNKLDPSNIISYTIHICITLSHLLSKLIL